VDPYAQLVAAVKAYFRLEALLFRTSAPMSQTQLDSAADMFDDARGRVLQLIGDLES
jgi:hypothetical protein